MKKFKSRFLWALYLGLSLISDVPCAISSMEGEEIRYEVTSRGFPIGDVIVAQKAFHKMGKPEIFIQNRTDVSASFLWIHYHQSLTEKAMLYKDDIVAYSRQGRNNAILVSIEGKLRKEVFTLRVSENGKLRVLDFPRRDYDRTTMECPEAFMDFGPSGKTALRLLDLENLEIVTRNYQLVREDVYRLGQKEYPCRVVDFSDAYKSCRRWIGMDKNTVIMFRQDGKSQEGSYSVRMVSLNRPLQCNQYEWVCDQTLHSADGVPGLN